jgi:uncharacterized protein (TIGR02466 family)
MTYEILKPFGPMIYKATLRNDMIAFFKDVAIKTKLKTYDVGQTLAGNIDKQYAAVMDEAHATIFNAEVKRHIHRALEEFDKKYDPNSKLDIDKLQYNHGKGPWINFQHAGEFNPIHTHTGELSVVIYIDIPECIADENKGLRHSNAPSAGMISWTYGDASMIATDYHYTHQPVTGELFIFPAQLQHLVYPFKSNVERISMSFNVHDIKIK